MEKERKSKLMHSYIYEEENSEDEDLKIDDGYIIQINENDHSDPLLTINNSRNNSDSKKAQRDSIPKFSGENIEEKQMLYDMGFKYQLINTIYNNMHPIDLQEALDYLNKNDKGKFTHSYIENDRFVCTICSQGRDAHENTALFVDNVLNNENNINSNEGINNLIETNILTTPNGNNNINNNNNLITNTTNYIPPLTNNSPRNSLRYNRIESSYLNSLNKYSNFNNKPKECGICGDTIEYQDTYKVKLSCNHYFCIDCWESYLKEKINNANVAKISCMQHGCSVFLSKEFIKKILNNDYTLIKKYEKFLEKQNLLLSNKNIKFCPIPDCDGYAEKKTKEKYVKCSFGHDFCFECLNKPHGSKKCEEMLDKEFEEWKKHKIVKRCPGCNMWTEKNEGCNHMTCVECKYQWCWLCRGKYDSNHYYVGSCKGLQFEKEQDEEKIKKLLERNLKRYPPPKCQKLRRIIKRVFIFILFIFLSPYFYFFKLGDRNLINDCLFYFYLASVFPVFISFEIFFITFNFIFFIPLILLSRKYRDLYDDVNFLDY